MADIRLDELAQQLGFTVDAADPVGSMKRMVDELREAATKGDANEARFKGLEDKLTAALERLAPEPDNDPITPASPKADDVPDTGRRAAEAMARVKTFPDNARQLSQIILSPARDENEKAMQEWNDALHITSRMLKVEPRKLNLYQDTIARNPDWAKTLTSDGSAGYGTDWVPTGMSSLVWEDLRLSCQVGANLVQVDMPTADYKPPYQQGSATVYLTAQATDITASNFTTGAVTLSAKGFGAATKFSGEMTEDSAAAVAPAVRRDIGIGLGEAVEDAILNADNASTNQDGVTSSTDIHRAWDGLRYLCLTDSTLYVDGGTMSDTIMQTARKQMKKYGVRPADLMWITGPSSYNAVLALTNVVTADKYGALATTITGELAKYMGIPILVSGQIDENLNASGVYDGSTTDNTCLFLVNKNCFYLGTRREIAIEEDRFILGDYSLIVGKGRFAFSPTMSSTPSSTYRTAQIVYNIPV